MQIEANWELFFSVVSGETKGKAWIIAANWLQTNLVCSGACSPCWRQPFSCPALESCSYSLFVFLDPWNNWLPNLVSHDSWKYFGLCYCLLGCIGFLSGKHSLWAVICLSCLNLPNKYSCCVLVGQQPWIQHSLLTQILPKYSSNHYDVIKFFSPRKGRFN